MKKFILGLIVGATVMATIPTYANTIEQIQAYLRPDISIEIDGNQVKLSKSVAIIDGSVQLPLRETATLFGKDVNWNESTQTVELSSIQNTSGGSNKMKVLPNYYDGSDAMQDGDIIYMSLPSGSYKYGIRQFIEYDILAKTVTFKGSTLSIKVLNEYTQGCEGFFRDGSTFIKEDYFVQAKKDIEKTQ